MYRLYLLPANAHMKRAKQPYAEWTVLPRFVAAKQRLAYRDFRRRGMSPFAARYYLYTLSTGLTPTKYSGRYEAIETLNRSEVP